MRRCPTTSAFSIVVSMKLTSERSATKRRTPDRAALKKLSLNFTAVDMSASPPTARTTVPASGASSRSEKEAVARTLPRRGPILRSEVQARSAHDLVRAQAGLELHVLRRRHAVV